MSKEKDLEARIRDQEAMHEILNLEAEYAFAVDTRQTDLLLSLFTEDGVVSDASP
ncbi:MAG: nuclear transport factor 2 family protein [Chloroflexi bacterium]|nr:nuclear transport factor 2 family protein [Chloroflexota bacterium]